MLYEIRAKAEIHARMSMVDRVQERGVNREEKEKTKVRTGREKKRRKQRGWKGQRGNGDKVFPVIRW